MIATSAHIIYTIDDSRQVNREQKNIEYLLECLPASRHIYLCTHGWLDTVYTPIINDFALLAGEKQHIACIDNTCLY